jgi:HSP20 family molecular chaperone IbpA
MSTHPFNQPSPQNSTPYNSGSQQTWAGGTQVPPTQARKPSWSPPIDVLDNEDELWVFVDLPGFTGDEMEVRGNETTLVVAAERFDEREEGRQAIVNERPTRYQRTVPLPVAVDIGDAEISYEDGVCKITLPKAESDRYQTIEF